MSDSPCHHICDFTDGDEPLDDLGCCGPIPVTKSCVAPTLPARGCSEPEPTVTYDEETETFTVTSELFDSNCSALLDSTGSPLYGLIA